MCTYNDYIEDVSRGVHLERHLVTIYMRHDWSDRADIVKENINTFIPHCAKVETTYFSCVDETRVCFAWTTIEKGII